LAAQANCAPQQRVAFGQRVCTRCLDEVRVRAETPRHPRLGPRERRVIGVPPRTASDRVLQQDILVERHRRATRGFDSES
jgi:hypothetical protein